jgi:hypothetical protein
VRKQRTPGSVHGAAGNGRPTVTIWNANLKGVTCFDLSQFILRIEGQRLIAPRPKFFILSQTGTAILESKMPIHSQKSGNKNLQKV